MPCQSACTTSDRAHWRDRNPWRLIPILLVVFGESTIEHDEGKIVIVRQTLQELVVFSQIKVSIQHGAICLDQGINFPCLLALLYRLLQHAGKTIPIPKHPVDGSLVW